MHVDNKTVSIYKNDLVGNRCLVLLLDLYLRELPQSAKDNDVFYCRSLVKYTEDGVWYSQQPRGVNYLNEMVKRMCCEANLEGRYTNHSLRASGATELFQSEVLEKVIQEITGHRSVKHFGNMKKYQLFKKKLLAIFLLEQHHRISIQKLKS